MSTSPKTIEWTHVSENIPVIIWAQENIFFGDFTILKGAELEGTYHGHSRDDGMFLAIFDLPELEQDKRIGITCGVFTVKLLDADCCFRCNKYYPISEFKRHALVTSTSPILSQVCSDCYRRVKNKVAEHNKNARKQGGMSTLKVFEWLETLLASEGKCHYCKREIGFANLIMEHMMPISWQGGNTKENVVPACNTCNSSKGDRDIATWRRHQEVKHLTELLQEHLQLSKFEVTNLAIKQLAIQEGLVEEDVTEVAS